MRLRGLPAHADFEQALGVGVGIVPISQTRKQSLNMPRSHPSSGQVERPTLQGRSVTWKLQAPAHIAWLVPGLGLSTYCVPVHGAAEMLPRGLLSESELAQRSPGCAAAAGPFAGGTGKEGPRCLLSLTGDE